MILPMIRYLEGHGVRFHYNTKVTNIEFELTEGRKKPKTICLFVDEHEERVDLTENDLVFITNGGCVESASIGAQDQPAVFNPTLRPGSGWDLWKKIAAQDEAFGHPEVFCSDPEQTNWMSATVTTLDERIVPYIQNICQRDPFSGRTVTGGIVTARDSGWLLSWTFNRQPQFRDQPKGSSWAGSTACSAISPATTSKSPCGTAPARRSAWSGCITSECPESRIEDLAERSANTVPVMMPYITAFFMPRKAGDRPAVVPEGAVNFAFLGQFAETKRDTIFTTEYSMRTGMEAVYTLLDIDRGVPEVWGSTYDVRDLLNAAVQLRDGKPLSDLKMNWIKKFALGKSGRKTTGHRPRPLAAGV